MRFLAVSSLALGICLVSGTVASGQAPEGVRRFTRTPYYTGPNDPERGKLRGTLKLGETVIIEVPGDTGDIDLKPGVVPDPNITPPRGSRPAGPFKIEGIKPGDWVAIRILKVEPGPYGYCNNHGPFRGPLRALVPIKDGMAHFPPDFVVPIRPMIGYVHFQSAAPPTPQAGAWDYGGNLDLNSVQAGSTVYIRSQVYGAMLTLADAHAYQSDGELSGTGVEIDVTVTLKLERVPGFPNGGVVVESADRWFATGIGADWEEALKVAWTEMVDLICHLYDTNAEHANRLVSTIGDVVPGYTARVINFRGFPRPSYITCQIAIPKTLRRTGKPFQP
ncbi:MAG: acetamidase/formamidase family protein [Bryobacteraceae bacterium]